jgi:ABC-type sugar transport system ATPase subunit
MSDRVAVFNDGIIQQLSTPDELYERPQNSFVAQFIGENNKLNGKVDRDEGEENAVSNSTTALNSRPTGQCQPSATRRRLSLRPERVEFEPAAASMDNTSRPIEELIYLGDHIRVRMKVAGNDEFIVKVRNRGDGRQRPKRKKSRSILKEGANQHEAQTYSCRHRTGFCRYRLQDAYAEDMTIVSLGRCLPGFPDQGLCTSPTWRCTRREHHLGRARTKPLPSCAR